jgi:hypothetical protein
MDVGSVINWSIAGWGAGLSTLLAALRLHDRKRRLRTTLELVAGQLIAGTPGMPAKMNYFTTTTDDPNAQFLALNAENVGERVVTLKAVGIQPPKKDFFIMPQSPSSSPFPRRVEPGDSCIDVWPAADVARSLRIAGLTGTIRLRGFYIDGVRKQYRANSFAFNIDAWTQK